MNKKDIFYLIIITIVVIFSVNSCNNQNTEIQRQKDNVKALQDSTTYFKNQKGETVATKLALQLTEKELKEEKKSNEDLKIALKNFKRPVVVIQSKQEVRIDTILVPYKDSIPFVFSRFERVKKEFFSLDLLSTNKGNTISNFKFAENRQDVVVGDKKNSMFKNAELRVDITNSNKYFNQVEVKPIVITYKKSWHEKPLITIPIGVVLGLLID